MEISEIKIFNDLSLDPFKHGWIENFGKEYHFFFVLFGENGNFLSETDGKIGNSHMKKMKVPGIE